MPDKNAPSKGLAAVMKRLNEGHSVPIGTIMRTVEMCQAEKRAERPQTDPYDDSRARIQIGARNALMSLGAYSGDRPDGKPAYAGTVKAGHEYHLMFGLPASGKSTIADRLSQAAQARIMDSDYVKEQIPEFDGGWGAAAVHKESKKVMSVAMIQALSSGANVIVPRIGTPPDEMLHMLKQARSQGYKCYAHYVDLSPEKAMGRLIGRYLSTGRYIPPEIAASKSGPDGENLVFESFKQVIDSGICDGWTFWSNDVQKGDPPVLLGYGANPDRSILNLIQGADTDKSRIVGVEPETPEHRAYEIGAIDRALARDDAENRALAEQQDRLLQEAEAKDAAVKNEGLLTARMMAMAAELDNKPQWDGGPCQFDGGPR